MSSRLTILMPVYNGEQFLKETIVSVLNQTFTDFIFLIINDGSTDNSMDIVRSFDDDRIQIVDNDENMGLVDTLNKGLDLSVTEYIARMDADDLWEPTKLEQQMKLMDKNPKIGLCGTSIRKFGVINGDFIFPENNDELKVGFLFYCTMSHPSVVFRRSFLQQTGLRYKKEMFPAEDYKMWIDCLDKTQIYNIPKVLVHYRQHEQQICQDKKDVQKGKTDLVRLEMLERIYPQATDQEKKFHIDQFISYNIKSTQDIKKHIRWAKKLVFQNQKNGKYIEPRVMKKELSVYLQASIKGYIYKKYFEQHNISNFFRYILSGDFKYLSLKRNIGILKKSFI